MSSEAYPPSQEPPTLPLAPNSAYQNPVPQQEIHHLLPNSLPTHSSTAPTPTAFQPLSPNKQSAFSQTLSWGDRSILTDMIQFGPDHDGFVVIVTPQAAKELQEGTHRDMPNEAFGFLMGRTYIDNKGIFTVVSSVVYAHRLNATPENFKLTGQEMRELRRTASFTYPIADFVGWTHSHTVYSPYSRVDQVEQARWTESYNVGILTFMHVKQGEPWAIAYRGPSSQPLNLQETAWFKGIEQQANASDEQEQEAFEQEPSVYDGSIADGQKIEALNKRIALSNGLLILALLLSLVISVIFGNALYSISNNVDILHAQFTSLSKSSPSESANFLWNCNVQNGVAPLKVKCNGPIGPNIKQWLWDFGDTTTHDGSSVTHTYQNPGTYVITLTITSVTGEQQIVGSLDITVTNPPTPIPTAKP